MPNNSETFNFTVNGTDVAQLTHPGDSAVTTRTSKDLKGDGFYGRADGFHTVQIDLNGFIGRIEIQGSLAIDPDDTDWFTVELGTGTQTLDTTGLIVAQGIDAVEYASVTTNNKSYNFTGNYVWIRAKVSNWTDGTVNSIQLNH